MTDEQAAGILQNDLSYPGYSFCYFGSFDSFDSYEDEAEPVLCAQFKASCSTTGQPKLQTTRKWVLDRQITPSQLVQTALKCVLASIEHEARERFKYRGEPIFGSHQDVDQLVDLMKRQALRPQKS